MADHVPADALLDAILAASPDGWAVVDRELRFVRLNGVLARLDDLRVEEVVGRRVSEVLPELGPGIEERYRRVFATGEAIPPEEVEGPRGVRRVSYFPVKDDSGLVVAAGTLVIDVPDRKGAEAAQAQIDALLEAAPAGIALLDGELRYLRVNRTLAAMNGMPVEAHLHRHTWEVLQPGRQTADVEEAVRRVLETGEAFRGLRFKLPVPGSSEPREWEAEFFPVLQDGRVTGVGGIVRDVTEQARTVEALQLALDERRLAVDIIDQGDACFAVDGDWRILLVNRNQERLTRTRREETVGRVLWEAFPALTDPSSRYWREYHRAMEERVPTSFEEFYPPLDRWFDVRVWPIHGGRLAVFFHDATDRKRVEQVQERLAGIVGHDLRNPLSAIAMAADLLLRREELPPSALRAVQRISTSARRMSRMIDELLDFTRARLGGGIAVHRRRVGLCGLARPIVDEFDLTHPGRVRLVCGSELFGFWDPDRLGQAISNLVGNALKHGSPTEAVEIRIEPWDGGASLSVHNKGEPIPPDRLRTIFDPFSRLEKSRGEGLGLGLYIVREIVVAHGGTIAVGSDERETAFRLRLPAA